MIYLATLRCERGCLLATTAADGPAPPDDYVLVEATKPLLKAIAAEIRRRGSTACPCCGVELRQDVGALLLDAQLRETNYSTLEEAERALEQTGEFHTVQSLDERATAEIRKRAERARWN